MHPVESIREVEAAIGQARTGSAYCTNFFPGPQKLQAWITRGELFRDVRDGVAFFLRPERGFWHLYFCAPNRLALQQATTHLPILGNEPVVLDLIGNEPALGNLVDLFAAAGLHRYNRLVRLARTGLATTHPATTADHSLVAIASPVDCQPILDLLLKSFDCHAEQIPMLYELEAAAAAGQIQVAYSHGKLAGFLYFETQGLSSLLRYWLIAPEFQAQGFGSALMRWYLGKHPAVRRFLLWVVASNHQAIRKYEHFGFAPEGLVDYVLANDKIHP